MKAAEVSFLQWQRRFGNERACERYLAQQRWPEGFVCPRCGHTQAYHIADRRLYQCTSCRHQVSVTAGTVFHSTNLPLVKWFWAIYWVSSDKGGISAQRLSKLIEVSWPTAFNLLRKLRLAMGHRDRLYRLGHQLIELDDALVGGHRSGKRGRGAAGKSAIVVACENRGQRAGFMAIDVVERVDKATVGAFADRHLSPKRTVLTDAWPALRILAESHAHIPEVTPPHLASTWLPWVHIAISNLKRFLLGTYHGVSPTYLQEYANEFCYRFNRRYWEPEIPNRLLRLCAEHAPIKLRTV